MHLYQGCEEKQLKFNLKKMIQSNFKPHSLQIKLKKDSQISPFQILKIECSDFLTIEYTILSSYIHEFSVRSKNKTTDSSNQKEIRNF